MNRPELETVLRALKPFQRRTVDHAFHQLFLAKDSTARFLVADEVGLGKTLVARGIIARAVDHLWDHVEHINIVYICSNANIARANLPKLQSSAGGHRSVTLSTRLTMLATDLASRPGQPGLAEGKLNFISFTPSTSFSMGHSEGWSEERAVLYELLKPLTPRHTGLQNLLQGRVLKAEAWRARLSTQAKPIEPSIRLRFEEAFAAEPALGEELERLITGWYFRHRSEWPAEAQQPARALIGELRALLAKVAVGALQPHLVILDEFQRFRTLIQAPEEGGAAVPDPAHELAQALFGVRTSAGAPVRTLMLSATPYKMFTREAELDTENHYADFLKTTSFLMGGDEGRVAALKGSLAAFGSALRQAALGAGEGVLTAKAQVEASLRAVMARTERVAASDDQDAMVQEPEVKVQLQVDDVRQYIGTHAWFSAVGDRDPMVLWKAAPYLAHFMRGYRLNSRVVATLESEPEKLAAVLKAHPDVFLSKAAFRAWRAIDPGHPKLRDLAGEALDGGLWRLLWMPPTVPYWAPEGFYEGQQARTKSLVFSSWNVVPDVISGVLSYEVERRMFDGTIEKYERPDRQRARLLRLNDGGADSRTRHRLLLLLLPCLTLADGAHPLAAPNGVERKAWVREQVERLLAAPGLPDPSGGRVDDRWEWAAPLVLDPGLQDSLRRMREGDGDPLAAGGVGGDDEDGAAPAADGGALEAYMDELIAFDVHSLGRRPASLVELLTELALGAPGVLSARMLASAGLDDHDRRVLAFGLAGAFWRLFNRPAVTSLLLQQAAGTGHSGGSEDSYWRLVLRYCRHGNLQAVLDEAWHLGWEQQAWDDRKTKAEGAKKVIGELVEAVKPTPSRVQPSLFRRASAKVVDVAEINLRTDYALRFGVAKADERSVHQDVVKRSFNSPFRPFVLASTSVGQEGLDFHVWCHRLVHWNLPGNPVDMEQREGRVHRFKGHAVRRNVADQWAARALAQWKPKTDLWQAIFALAEQDARQRDESDLVPCWLAPGKWRVLRHVPTLPHSQEVAAFALLKRQLAAYRVVFGQPRQEELIALLGQSEMDVAQLREWAVDLSPPKTSGA